MTLKIRPCACMNEGSTARRKFQGNRIVFGGQCVHDLPTQRISVHSKTPPAENRCQENNMSSNFRMTSPSSGHAGDLAGYHFTLLFATTLTITYRLHLYRIATAPMDTFFAITSSHHPFCCETSPWAMMLALIFFLRWKRQAQPV